MVAGQKTVMTTLAHALSGSIVTLLFLKVPPTDIQSIFLTLASGAILDIDHPVMMWVNRDHFKKHGVKGQLHLARSFWHELLGLFFGGAIALVLSFVDLRLALLLFLPFAIHLMEDMLIGKFFPFTPFDKTEIQLFSVPLKMKPLVDVFVLALSGGLWLAYLSGR